MVATQWLRGTVKNVLSGDTLVIVGTPAGGPPPEKQITLSSLKAPRLGRRDGTVKDEPFAWESKEFLRKKCVGKVCVFSVDYKLEVMGNREFGSVFLDKENVGETVVAEGWAKVNAIGPQKSPYIEVLQKQEAVALAKGLGVWTKDEAILEAAAIEASADRVDVSSKELVDTSGRGNSISAIVDQVLNPGMLRVTILPSRQSVVVYVAGIMAPKGRVRSETGEEVAEPFFLQSKYFTEMRALNRDVRLVLQDLDKFDNLSAIVYYPKEDEEVDLGQELLKTGFAKVFERGMTTGSTKLRELERTAKQQKVGMWRNYTPVDSNSAKLTDQFVGKVVEVVSGDTIVVLDKASRLERRVQLSSLRAPKMGNPNADAAPWATEAKDFLRKLVIGKEVMVQMEYTRKIVPTPGMVMPSDRQQMTFGNVTFKNKDEDVNVSEKIVANGWAGLVRHNSDEERSAIYETLMELDAQAKTQNKGTHSTKPAPARRQNDVSGPAPGETKRARFIARAQGYLPFLQRAGKIRGTVEYVLSGHKLKIFIPRENVTIAFAPSGINTPQRAQPARDGKPATEADPYANEAVVFTREHVNQRDVDILVETVNKGGTFLGTLTVPGPKPFDLGLGLVENGLATLHPFFDTSTPSGRQLFTAEKIAKEKKLKIWESYDPAQDIKDEDLKAASISAPLETETIPKLTVTEVTDGNTFFAQVLGDDTKIEWITQQLRDPSLTQDKPQGAPPTKGSWCAAKFTLDNLWYRGYVQESKGTALNIYFVDFGNSEELPPERLRPLDPSLTSIPPQAHLWQLAFVKVPSLEKDEDYAYDAASQLSFLVGGGKELKASVIMKEKAGWSTNKHPKTHHPKKFVILSEVGAEKDINAQMLESGFARLPPLDTIRNPNMRAAAQKYAEFEALARKQHRGIFVYGDPGDSDDEMDMPVRGRR